MVIEGSKEYKLGEYFGYPKCCIESFMDGTHVISTSQKIAGKKTGFIPCPRHSLLINSGMVALESLINNRQCTTKFPMGK